MKSCCHGNIDSLSCYLIRLVAICLEKYFFAGLPEGHEIQMKEATDYKIDADLRKKGLFKGLLIYKNIQEGL